MRIVAAPLTLEQYLALPDDGLQYEVVEGQPIVNPSPVPRHQAVVVELLHGLRDAVPAGYLALPAPLDWVLWQSPSLQIRQPDVMVVARSELAAPRLSSPPLLAVEVLSAGSFERDLIVKRAEYGRAGLRDYWVVDPDEPSIVVYRADENGRLTEHQRAPGDDQLRVDEPVALVVRPVDLVTAR